MNDHDHDHDLPDADPELASLLDARAERGNRRAPGAVVAAAMAQAHAPIATHRRRTQALIAAAVALVLVGGGAAALIVGDDDDRVDVRPAGSTSAPRPDPAPSSTVAATTTSEPVPTMGPGSYLEETRPSSRTVALTLHSPDGGAIRQVYSAPTLAIGDDPASSPILDAELTPDGGIYVVERTDPSAFVEGRPGGTRLAEVGTDGAPTTVTANVVGSELSPDGSRLAIVVLSPDGNGDGNGTQAIRVLDLATGAIEELWSTDVSLDDTGVIDVETGRIDVVGWTADQQHLIVQESCCDSGAVMLMPSSGRSTELWNLPAVRGDHATYALGTDAEGRILVQRTVFAGDGVTVAAEYDGIEVVALALDGTVSAPIFTEPATEEVEDRVRFDLIGDQVAGTVLPIAAQGDPLLFGAGDERTARRFL